jgi:dTMP kinase
MKRGALVVIEGQDGVGKTTAIQGVGAALQSAGHEVIYIREPGGTVPGERIRDILKDSSFHLDARAEALLFAAGRAQLAREVIEPALERGAIVISDRSFLSSLAYQGVGRDLGVEAVRAINVFALDGSTADRTLVLELSPEESSRRLATRVDVEHDARFEEDAFQRKVKVAYETLCVQEPNHQLVSADGTPAEVVARCLAAFDDLLPSEDA